MIEGASSMKQLIVFYFLRSIRQHFVVFGVLFSLTIFLGAAARAQSACSLPVCDIPGEVYALKNSPQSARYQFLVNIHAEYKKTQDPLILANLKDFAIAAEAMLREVQEEDWLIREAQSLLADSILGLARYARPVSAAQLTDWYGQLATEDPRFAVLAYWTAEIPTLEDTAALDQLVTFARAARNFSASAGDDDYVLRQCDIVMSQATRRLAQLDPFHEGVYQIQLACAPTPEFPGPCNPTELQTSRLVVLQTEGDEGLVVSFAIPQLNLMVFSFSQTVLSDAATLITGSSRDNQRPAEFSIQLDKKTGKVSGNVYSTWQVAGYTFTGHRLRTAADFPAVPAVGGPVAGAADVQGVYTGALSTMAARLVVRENSNGGLGATLINPNFNLNFQTGILIPGRGLFALISQQTRVFGKIFMQRGAAWSGFYFNQYGQVLEARFSRPSLSSP
jgi:hypothetical protein